MKGSLHGGEWKLPLCGWGAAPKGGQGNEIWYRGQDGDRTLWEANGGHGFQLTQLSLLTRPPPPLQGYHEYVDKNLPPESPCLYGLHPNAETGFLTATSEMLFRTVLEMQPKETGSGAGGTGVSREEKVGA